MKAALKAAGLPLRHTFATLALADSGYEALCRAGGHNRPTRTFAGSSPSEGESERTTRLYDRSDDPVTLDEIERVNYRSDS